MPINANLAATKTEHHRASAGMKNPTVTMLKAGDNLFRFASTKTSTGADIPSEEWANGAWWFSEKDHNVIVTRFNAGKLPLGTVARVAGAVQPSWSRMDVSIKATLLQDIYVYIGKGSAQYREELPNGWFITQKGWADIDQIYIPNMRLGARAGLKILKQKIIQTNAFGY